MAVGLRRLLISAASVVLVVGLSLSFLLMPWFTEVAVPTSGAEQLTGMPRERVRALAEEVRAFVTTTDAAPLPETVDGSPGFGAAEVEHLLDVRGVILAARWATVVIAVLLALLAAESVAAHRLRDVARGLRNGGRATLGAMAVVLVAGLADFDAVFTAFHRLFFAEGTWEFPADSLLIQLFPFRFWVSAGALWAAAAAVLALGLIVSGRAGVSLARTVRAE